MGRRGIVELDSGPERFLVYVMEKNFIAHQFRGIDGDTLRKIDKYPRENQGNLNSEILFGAKQGI